MSETIIRVPGKFVPFEAGTPLMDEKDIKKTSQVDSEDVKTEGGVLKLADKAYVPNDFSGMGRVYLRKNMINASLHFADIISDLPSTETETLFDCDEIVYETTNNRFLAVKHTSEGKKYYPNYQFTDSEVYSEPDDMHIYVCDANAKLYTYNDGALEETTTLMDKNVLTQDMINKPNTIYIIQYDYDIVDKEDTTTTNNLTIGEEHYSYKPITIEDNQTYRALNDCVFIDYQHNSLIGSVLVTGYRESQNYAIAKKSSAASGVPVSYYSPNGTINVPDGSVLKFEGGCIKNGTLNGNFDVDSPDKKIFDNVTFSGGCISRFFSSYWFVGKYCDIIPELNVADTYPDATAELQQMFNSGVKKVYMSNNHHYRITDTITVSADITIDGKMQRNGYHGVMSKENCYWIFGRIEDAPLIKIIAPSNTVTHSATFRNLYVYRCVVKDDINEVNEYKRAVSTIKVDCTNGSIWGIYMVVAMRTDAYPFTVICDDGTTEVTTGDHGGYTGVEIYAANGKYATYVDIDGYISWFYEALQVNVDNNASSTWITGVTARFDSVAVYGGTVNPNYGGRCGDLTVFGQHQTCSCLRKNTDAYFTAHKSIMGNNATIWDVHSATAETLPANKLGTVEYAFKAETLHGLNEYTSVETTGNIANRKKSYQLYGLGGNAKKEGNVLASAFMGMDYMRFVNNSADSQTLCITNPVYEAITTEDVAIPITENNTIGYRNLFYPDKRDVDLVDNLQRSRDGANLCYLNTDDRIKAVHVSFEAHLYNKVALIIHTVSSNIKSLRIKLTNIGAQETVISDETFSWNPAWYNPFYYDIRNIYTCKVDVWLEYKHASKDTEIAYYNVQYSLPFVGLCGDGIGELTGPWGGWCYGPFVGRELISKTGKLVRYHSHRNTNALYGDGGYTLNKVLAVTCNNAAWDTPIFVDIVGSTSKIKLELVHRYNSAQQEDNNYIWLTYEGRYSTSTNLWPVRVFEKVDFNFAKVTWVIFLGGQYQGYIDKVTTTGKITILNDAELATIIGETMPHTFAPSDFQSEDGWNEPKLLVGSNVLSGESIYRPGEAYSKLGLASVSGMAEGLQYFDTTLGLPIYRRNGTWVKSNGVAVSAKQHGAITERPALDSIKDGFVFIVTTAFTVDTTNYPAGCYGYIGNDTWVTADGQSVADTALPART